MKKPLYLPGDYAYQLQAGSKSFEAYMVVNPLDAQGAEVCRVRVKRVRKHWSRIMATPVELEDGAIFVTAYLFPCDGYEEPTVAVWRDGHGSVRKWVALPVGAKGSDYGIVLLKDMVIPQR